MINIIASGYFNPLHKGHIDYLESARKLGDRLIVIVNNDNQVKLKGSKVFQDMNERMKIIGALKCVDMVVASIDDGRDVCETIIDIIDNNGGEFLFANGGDVTKCPEEKVIECVYNVGGEKTQSSSELLK